MCMSFHPAKLTNTFVFTHALSNGQHLLGYQNIAEDISHQKLNAMLLPIPSANPLTSLNMLDTENCPNIFKDMKQSLPKRLSRSLSFGAGSAGFSKSFQVFKNGSYTVYLDKSATSLRLNLNKLPENDRPEVNDAINESLKAYQQWYPKWWMALCTWKNTIVSTPMLWQFDSLYPEKLFMPGLDSHDGSKPNLNNKVERDHTLLVGSVCGYTVNYTDILSTDLDNLLPKKILGIENVPNGPNKDWWIDLKDLEMGKNPSFKLESPPGA